jgi:predicted ATPase
MERPIVLFIDDLQWSDGDTLKLVHSLFTNEDMEGLLVVGAYRDHDEIDDLHAVAAATLKKITETESRVTKVAVACLTEVTINELGAFATELRVDQREPLSQLIHRKTLENCFFVTQFLEMLQDDGLLSFSFVSYQWEWKLDNIAAKTDISENVVDLVVNRIGKLDLRSQEILKIAGCLGSQFTVDVLNVICCNIMTERLEVEVGMIANPDAVRSGETNGAVGKLLSMRLVEWSRGDWIKFSHDRIQQAAESWLEDEQEKLAFRLQIGRILKDHLQSEGVKNNKECVVADWLFFTAIGLLNTGSQLISMQQEKYELVILNRTAAEKASERSAFLPTAAYNEAAILLCGERLWMESPDLAMELHDAAATCYIKCGKCVRSFELAQEMVWHASNPQSRLRGQFIQLDSLEQQRRFDNGPGLKMAMLRSLGERFPWRPNTLHAI